MRARLNQSLNPRDAAVRATVMRLIVDRMAEILASDPDPITPAAGVAARRPANGSEIPAVAVSLTIDHTRGTGFGRFIRSGNVIAQHVAIVNVTANPETFSSDLRHLRIAPLPVRKNPDSSSEELGAEDVQVRNVTDAAHSIDYRVVDRPTQREDYQIDEEQEQIIFGGPQTAGDSLQVTHWTVTWRDDIVGERYSGLMSLEIWASSANQADTMSRKVQDRLMHSDGKLRANGFMKLQAAGLDPLENVRYEPPSGSPFPVWKQCVSYRFAFEAEEGGELSDGMPIKRIGVDFKHPRESFSIP